MVVCARLPNKPNMGGQNSLMSLVFWFPCWKNTNTSVQTNFWIINCLILFSITNSLWGNRAGIKVVVHVIVLTNSSLTWNPDAWHILYSLILTDALLKLWRHEGLRGLYKVTLICICWQLFDWLIKLKIEIILTVCAGLVVKYAGYWSLIKSTKSKKSQVVCTAPCVP